MFYSIDIFKNLKNLKKSGVLVQFKKTKLSEKEIRRDGEICHELFDRFTPELDDYTKGHCERVSSLSHLVMERVVSETSLSYNSKLFYAEAAKYAGLLHDIDKVEFPDQLRTDGEIPETKINEYIEFVLKHPMKGFDKLVKEIAKIHIDEFIVAVMDAVLHHHERYDGDNSFAFTFTDYSTDETHEVPGYPHGLKGEEITPPARVIYLIDFYDAATTRQAYKQREAVLKRIREGRNTYFDPEVVQSFLEVEEKLFTLEMQFGAVNLVDDVSALISSD